MSIPLIGQGFVPGALTKHNSMIGGGGWFPVIFYFERTAPSSLGPLKLASLTCWN